MASRTDGAAAPRIIRPTRQIGLMLIILGCVVAGGVWVWPRVEAVFLTSPYLNGTIGVVFVVGVLACFSQVFQLFSSVSWIEQVGRATSQEDIERPPRLLAAATGILRGRGARMQITPASARSVLDSVGARMEESRDITRYIANLLIFLGLLGTFFGLATTVPAVVETIRSLNPAEGEEGLAVFGRLMNGLEDQLGGMGTAFASSLLGLAGSLVVGLLELFAGHGQNRFYRELEEWLASITRVSFSSGDGEGGVDRGAIATVLDHMVDQIDALQSMFAQTQARQEVSDERVTALTQSVGDLTQQLGFGQVEAVERLSAAQDRLSAVLEQRGAMESSGAGGDAIVGGDDESRMRLRSIDVQLFKIIEEMGKARSAEIDALRGEMGQLTVALRALTQAAQVPVQTRRRAAPTTARPQTPPKAGE